MSQREQARSVASDGVPQRSQPIPIAWRTTVPVLVALVIAVYVLLPRFVELDEALGVARRLRGWAVALAAVLQTASYVAGAYMMRHVARLTGDHLSLWHALRLGLAASAVGLVAAGPVGYAAASQHWLKRQGFSQQGATLLSWMPALLNATAFVVLALVGLLYIFVAHGIGLSWPISTALILVAVLLFGSMVLPLVSSDEFLVSMVRRARIAWGRIRRKPVPEPSLGDDREEILAARRAFGGGGWRAVTLGTVLRSACDAASLFFLFVAAGLPITLGKLMAGYALPQVVGRVAPGGVGLVEGGMVGLYTALGVPAATGIVVVLMYRVLSFWLPFLAGVPLAVMEQRAGRQAA